MALKVNKREETDRWVEAGEDMWLNAGQDKLVPEGHADAAFLYAREGDRVSVEDAEKYGLAGGKKQVAQVENKQEPARANKARKRGAKQQKKS